MLRHAQGVRLVHDDAVGITAVGHAAGNLVRRVVGEGRALLAELFEAVLAILAGAAGIHHAADGGDVAFLEFFDVCADFHHAPDDFMAGHAGIGCAVPFIADDVDIRMADAAEKNLYLHIMRAGFAALQGKRRQWRGCGCGGISFCCLHV
jgi:hypothetical protein